MNNLTSLSDYKTSVFENTISTEVPSLAIVLSASIADLMQLVKHAIQRDETLRLGKMKKIFDQNMPTMHNFAAVNLTTDIMVEDMEVPAGIYMLDGHTRIHYYRNFPEKKPSHNVVVNMYTANNASEYINLYYAFDSSDSVESSGHKLQGIFNLLGIREKISSPILIRGAVKTAIDLAYPGTSKDPLIEKVSFFKDEIITLERMGIWQPTDTSFRFQTFYTACLMACKIYYTYSPENPKGILFAEMMSFLKSIESDSLNTSNDKWDGKTAMAYEILRHGDKGWIPDGLLAKTSFASIDPQLSFFLYCIELYITGKQLNKKKGYQAKNWMGSNNNPSVYQDNLNTLETLLV